METKRTNDFVKYMQRTIDAIEEDTGEKVTKVLLDPWEWDRAGFRSAHGRGTFVLALPRPFTVHFAGKSEPIDIQVREIEVVRRGSLQAVQLPAHYDDPYRYSK